MIRIIESSQIGKLLARKAARLVAAEDAVRPILEDVRKGGDKAVLAYARMFDGFDRRTTLVPAAELKVAAAALSSEFKQAVEIASHNIREYAKFQLPAVERAIDLRPGIRVGQIMRPLDTV